MIRSFLFVPAESEHKMQKAAAAGADALILDLEDSVTAGARPVARLLVTENLAGRGNSWVGKGRPGCGRAAAQQQGGVLASIG